MSRPQKTCPRCNAAYDFAAAYCPRDGSTLVSDSTADPYVGRTLLEQFVVEERLGAGGMGTVYRARQIGVEREVAIKILHPELIPNQDVVRRFQREARLMAALDHPNIVRVFLYGQLPDGNLYIAMEYLRGVTLATGLREVGVMSVERALAILLQLCAAMAEAHRHGVVHRDLKPENVYLTTRAEMTDFVKVLDFGIARSLFSEQSIATQSGLIFGTAKYISPEGAAGEPTDPRSDVYSIGVIAFQLLSGETPFESPSAVALLMKHIHEPAPDLRSRMRARTVPARLADVIGRALSKQPDRRPRDANALGLALREAAEQSGLIHGSSSPSSAGSISSSGGSRGVSVANASLTQLGIRPRTRWRTAGIAAVAFGVGATAVATGAALARFIAGDNLLLASPGGEILAPRNPAMPPLGSSNTDRDAGREPLVPLIGTLLTEPTTPTAKSPAILIASQNVPLGEGAAIFILSRDRIPIAEGIAAARDATGRAWHSTVEFPEAGDYSIRFEHTNTRGETTTIRGTVTVRERSTKRRRTEVDNSPLTNGGVPVPPPNTGMEANPTPPPVDDSQVNWNP